MKEKKKILFVCLGNICRSSSAEGVMRHLIEEAGREDEFYIESAATSREEIGNFPIIRESCPTAGCVPMPPVGVTT